MYLPGRTEIISLWIRSIALDANHCAYVNEPSVIPFVGIATVVICENACVSAV